MPVLTRRAALAQKSISNVIPNELSTAIISLCETSTKSALCRVSKLFKLLAEPQLYRIVTLPDKAGIISFQAALTANPRYAAWVRNLRIVSPWVISPVDDTMKPINYILQSTTELRWLLLGLAPDYLLTLKRLSFPHLHSLKIHTLDCDQAVIAEFLNRHPTLLHLALFFKPQRRMDALAVANLPNLVTYEGFRTPPRMLNANKLRSIRLRAQDIDDLTCFPRCQDYIIIPGIQGIVKRLKHHLPRIRYCIFDMWISKEWQNLQDFKQLESFGLFFNYECTLETLSDEYRNSFIHSWVKKCPTLQECLLGSFIVCWSLDDGSTADRYRVGHCRMETIFPFRPLDG
ncbi:hypothetical protein C8J56DRAFT_953508 [Mycena floridula]|nr:hypothetical protein C8J56DRAFT_953508 [Mycena floridula]